MKLTLTKDEASEIFYALTRDGNQLQAESDGSHSSIRREALHRRAERSFELSYKVAAQLEKAGR